MPQDPASYVERRAKQQYSARTHTANTWKLTAAEAGRVAKSAAAAEMQSSAALMPHLQLQHHALSTGGTASLGMGCQSVTAPDVANATAQEYAAAFAGQLASASSMGCLDFMPALGISSSGLCIAQVTWL